VPEDGSYERRHVVLCDKAKCCVGRNIFVCMFMIRAMTQRDIQEKKNSQSASQGLPDGVLIMDRESKLT
jgi:hypothetical protein